MKELAGNKPFISIIIPCRNEEKFIGQCLDSILANGYPKENLEILVVDGISKDKSREIIKEYLEKYPFINLLENPNKFTPFALNIGIKNARGEIILRMDAHSTYEKNYISNCIKYLDEYKVDNVGGIWKIIPRENTLINKSICFASSSVFGAGNAYYRIGYSKGIKLVDTVHGGCYKKEVFEKIGLFNENLVRSQDMEFNLRLKKAGGKILLVPDIVSYYYPKSNLKDFLFRNFQDGFWAIYPLKFVKTPLRLRHYIPLIFITSLIGIVFLSIFFPVFFRLFWFILGLYFFINIYFAFQVAVKKKDFGYFFVMPTIFAIRHIGYGLGSICGLVKLLK